MATKAEREGVQGEWLNIRPRGTLRARARHGVE